MNDNDQMRRILTMFAVWIVYSLVGFLLYYFLLLLFPKCPTTIYWFIGTAFLIAVFLSGKMI